MGGEISNLVAHAKHELELAGWVGHEAFYGGMMADCVMELIEVFDAEGHSGGSASIAMDLFQKLARFEPLLPLTGGDDEWTDMTLPGSERLWQNKRCSRVFKRADGSCFDVAARVFVEPDGACLTNGESHVAVTFPYLPKTEYVDVKEAEAA